MSRPVTPETEHHQQTKELADLYDQATNQAPWPHVDTSEVVELEDIATQQDMIRHLARRGVVR